MKTMLLYVSINGDDRWSGRLPAPAEDGSDGPLATLGRARDVLRKLKKDEDAVGPATVMIREGKYLLNDTLVLGLQDGGSRGGTVLYCAYPGERVFISGGSVVGG